VQNIKFDNSTLVFGPIPSRRFGTSLGIDLSPNSKQCNFDCLYCELKPAKTVDKQIDSPKVKDIIYQVKQALKKHSDINAITLSANGEPTLYPYLDELIDALNLIKGNIKTLILSNAGTIYKKNIQESLLKLDIVKLSLDCISKTCFKKLDRTNKVVNCQEIVQGIIDFKDQYKKDLIIEILFVKDLNDNDDEIQLLYTTLNKIKPDRIDIGTIDRPPAYDVKPITYQKLEDIAQKFQKLPVNIVYKNRPKNIGSYSKQEIVDLLKMRPLTKEDIENTFDNESKIILSSLIKESIIKIVSVSDVQFYTKILLN